MSSEFFLTRQMSNQQRERERERERERGGDRGRERKLLFECCCMQACQIQNTKFCRAEFCSSSNSAQSNTCRNSAQNSLPSRILLNSTRKKKMKILPTFCFSAVHFGILLWHPKFCSDTEFCSIWQPSSQPGRERSHSQRRRPSLSPTRLSLDTMTTTTTRGREGPMSCP